MSTGGATTITTTKRIMRIRKAGGGVAPVAW
jgi:hypothetical protein